MPQGHLSWWLPYLRLAVTLALAAAVGTGAHSADGTLDVPRNPTRHHRHRPAVRHALGGGPA